MITEYAAYTTESDSVTLYRLYGKGPVAEIPRTIDGKKVERLADHLFAGEMSVMCAPEKLSLARPGTDRWERVPDEEYPSSVREMEQYALCRDAVEVISIPEGVRQIGNYAFYGLYNLREVRFPSSLRRIGWGMYNGCRKMERLVFHLSEDQDGTPSIMKEVLDALSNEVEVIVMKGSLEQYRLRFPEYYEEGKENTPARIIEIIYHGTGHQYRNCFLGRVLQFERYDDIFPLAAAQESLSTNAHLILNRLMSGPEPKKEAAERYLNYLRMNNGAVTEMLLDEDELDPVSIWSMLDKRDYFTQELIDETIQKASASGNTAATGCLMNIRGCRFAGRKRSRYEL